MKAKIKFNALAVAMMIEKNDSVNDAWEKYHFAVKRETIVNQVRLGFSYYATNHLRKVLREVIEPNQELTKQYLENVDELIKQEDFKGFSIKIVGAGTKNEIIKALEQIVFDLKGYSTKELNNGVEHENEALVFKTDTFESYTGYTNG